jgi:hypothetical protein
MEKKVPLCSGIMELEYEDKKIIIENKVITALDEFVLDFTSILGKYTDYVIVY